MSVNRGKRFVGSYVASMLLAGLAACSCPKPEAATPPDLTSEEKTQVSVAREQLALAERKGTWEPQDDAKFSATIATVPPGARLELAKDLASRLNSTKLRPVHLAPKPGQVVCPGLCDSGVRATTQTVPSTTGKPDTKPDVK
jgi:hypothetical protein